MAQTQRDVPSRLAQAAKGNCQAISKLVPLVYRELRRLAVGYMDRERTNPTLQPTAVVHQAYLKFVPNPPVECKNRGRRFGDAESSMPRQWVRPDQPLLDSTSIWVQRDTPAPAA